VDLAVSHLADGRCGLWTAIRSSKLACRTSAGCTRNDNKKANHNYFCKQAKWQNMVAGIKGPDLQMVLSTGMHQSHEKGREVSVERDYYEVERIGGISRNEV